MQRLPDFAYQLQGAQAEENFIRFGERDDSSWPKKALGGLLRNFYSTLTPFQRMKEILTEAGIAVGVEDFSQGRISMMRDTDNGGAYIAGTGCIVIDKKLVTMESMRDVEKLITLLAFLPHEMTHAVHDCQGLVSVTPADMDKGDYIRNFMATEAAAYANTIMAHWYLSHQEPMADKLPQLRLIWPSIEKADTATMNPATRAFHDVRLIFGRHAGTEGKPQDLKAAWKASFKAFFSENAYLPLAYLPHMSQNYDLARSRLTAEFNKAAQEPFTTERLQDFMNLPGFAVRSSETERGEMLAANKALLAQYQI